MHENIPNLFECWTHPVVHLLTYLKELRSNQWLIRWILSTWYINCHFWTQVPPLEDGQLRSRGRKKFWSEVASKKLFLFTLFWIRETTCIVYNFSRMSSNTQQANYTRKVCRAILQKKVYFWENWLMFNSFQLVRDLLFALLLGLKVRWCKWPSDQGRSTANCFTWHSWPINFHFRKI